MDPKTLPQNLINQVKPESFSSHGPGFYKLLVLDFLTVAAAALLGYVYKGYLASQFGISFLLFALALFGVASVLQVFLGKDFGRRILVLFLETMTLLIFFYSYDIRILGISAVILFFFLVFGEIAGRREIENGLNLRFFRTTHRILPKLVTALLLVFIILYFPQWQSKNEFFSEKAFQGLFDWSAGVAGNIYPEITFNSSFQKLAEGFANFQLKNNAAFVGLPSDAKQKVVEQTASQIADNLGKSLGTVILPQDSVGKVFYGFIIRLLEGWRTRFGNFFLIGWFFALFLILRGFGTIFYMIISFISFIVYQILLAAGAIRIVGESRTKEAVEF